MTGWIVHPRDRIEATLGRRRSRPIDLVVVHWTGSPFTDDDGERRRLTRWAGSRKSSTHFVIGRTGRLYQMTPLDVVAEHTDDETARWRGEGGVDARSIGIDFMNVGHLASGPRGFINEYGGLHTGPRIQKAGARWFEAYEQAALDTMRGLVESLVELYPVLGDPGRWVGHDSIQRPKPDPGPVFPWGEVQAWIAGARDLACGPISA